MTARHLKTIIAAAAVAASLSLGTVALTTAHLYSESVLVNKANKGTVTNRIDENFNGTEKTNVRIENTGNMNAYVRVAIVPIWRDTDGSPTMLPTKDTYSIELNTKDWFLGEDGYYYCKADIAPSEKTPELIRKCTLNELTDEAYNNKYFDLQILAQSIQSDPQTAVQNAWAVRVDETGQLTA
ncbi:MAG: hypothetical protein ACI4M3_09550 [Acutalibacteraceae bacterium]